MSTPTVTSPYRLVLGLVLRNLRQEAGLTLRDVERLSGVSLGHISEIERGVKECSSEILLAIIAAYNLKLHQFLYLVADQAALRDAELIQPLHLRVVGASI